jgi:ElaB/YqjD/DUF883 family membrane-anchored ribosome-binding protein
VAKLKAVLDSLDGVDEAVQAHYSKGEDERHYLNLDGVDEHPAVLGLVRKKDELLTEAKTLKEKLSAYAGIEDPAAAAEALKRLPDLEEQLKKGGKGAEEIQRLQRDHQTQLEAVRNKAQEEAEKAQEEAKRARTAAERYFRESEISKAVTAHDGEPDLLSHVVEGFLQTETTEDGKFKLKVLDANGIERIKDAKGTPFTVEDLVAELKESPKYGRAFKPTGRSGSGASGGRGGNEVPGTVRAEGGMVTVDPADVLSGKTKVSAGSD